MFKFRRATNNDDAGINPGNAVPAAGDEAPALDADSMDGAGSGIASVESLGATSVVTVTNERITADAAAELFTLILELSNDGAKHFVLDLQNSTYLDSAGLGVLVRLLQQLDESGGRIALANVNPYVASLFRITRLDRAFPICRDTMAAIAAVERAA
ncbi:MAG: STAS domain-containing protein [Phycisphaerales bacterium]